MATCLLNFTVHYATANVFKPNWLYASNERNALNCSGVY